MAANHHGSLVILQDRGVLITGPSGSGKTTLALALITHGACHGCFARLVSDDQVLLSERNGRVIGQAPPPIAGLAEARGLGPSPLPHELCAVIDLLVHLVPADMGPRFQGGRPKPLEGVTVPCLELAERNTRSAVYAIAARLSLAPFS